MRRRLSGALPAVLLVVACAGCRARGLAFMPPDAATSTPPAPPTEEPNEIHYTITGPNSVAFDWLGTSRSLRYWSKEAPPRTAQAHAPTPAPISATGRWEEVELTDLAPGGDYGYVVGDPARPISGSFRAPPPPGTAGFAFVAVGDIGASSDVPDLRTIHRLISLAEPAFVLALGDLTYADSHTQSSVDRHFEDVMAWSRSAAYMPVWGNHEWENPARDDLRNYKGRFALPHAQASPGAPTAGCCGEDWYWFDYGAVRFITYPEPYRTDTWTDWAARAEPIFAAAERDPAVRFTVTLGHRPSYSSAHHGGEEPLRALLDGLGRRFPKYVLNLAWHSHAYERTSPQAHVVHITAGIGGGALEHAPTACGWARCARPAWSAFRALHHGFLRLAVEPRTIRVEAVCGPATPGSDDLRCAEGEIMDSATVRAGG